MSMRSRNACFLGNNGWVPISCTRIRVDGERVIGVFISPTLQQTNDALCFVLRLGVSGDKLGHFHQGAAFGDISALGLFGMRTFSGIFVCEGRIVQVYLHGMGIGGLGRRQRGTMDLGRMHASHFPLGWILPILGYRGDGGYY